MASLDNTNKDLIEGLVTLLRENVSGWSTSSEYGVDNVWGKNQPSSVSDEFPRGTVDIINGSDFELSIDNDTRLREVTVSIVVFGENPGPVETLVDGSEDSIIENWELYTKDWTFREVDGFTPLTENNDESGKLRMSRSVDMLFETVRLN